MKVERRSLLRAMSVGAALAPAVVGVCIRLPKRSSVAGCRCGQTRPDGPNVSFAKQIERNVAPVLLQSTFLVKPEHVDDFLIGFQKRFAIMRKQPGLISAQLVALSKRPGDGRFDDERKLSGHRRIVLRILTWNDSGD